MAPVFSLEEITEMLCEVSPAAARIYAERVEYVAPEPETPSDVPVELGYHMRSDDDLWRLANSRGLVLEGGGSKADLIELLLADDENRAVKSLECEIATTTPAQFIAVKDDE